MTHPPSSRRVALLCQHFYPELISTGMHMTELAESLVRLGWQVTVFCAQPTLDLEGGGERVPSEIEHAGIRVLRVRAWGSHGAGLAARLAFAVTYLLSTLAAVVRRRSSFDVVLVTTNPPFLGLVGRLVRALGGPPYAVIVYDVYPDLAVRLGVLGRRSPAAWLWERVTRAILAKASSNVVIGRDMEKLIHAKLPARLHGTTTLIPNWSDENLVRPVPRETNPFRAEHGLRGRTVVQYSGRMARTHNLEPLVEAAGHLRDLPVTILLIGDGAKKKELQRIAAERGLDNVLFLPYQPRERLDEVLSAADLAVVCLGKRYTGVSVPSKTYGIMAAGVPILAFVDPESEIGLAVAEEGCGLVLPDPTPEGVATVLRGLVNEPERLETMAEASRRAFTTGYTLSLAARRYSDMLASVIERGRS